MLEEKLNMLWASVILDYRFDMLRNEITFELETIDGERKNRHTLEFKKVSMWYFINNFSDYRKRINPPEEGSYLEITSIEVFEDFDIIIGNSQQDWLKKYNSQVNVSIEIWNQFLFIEAAVIKLDGIEYPLI